MSKKKERKSNPFSRLLLMCSGVDLHTLKQSNTDTGIYQRIGGFVLFTAIYATVAAGFTLSIIFGKSWISICFGLLWGFTILNLDGFIVGSMIKRNPKDVKFQEGLFRFFAVLLRIFLATLIAITISIPIEIQFFHEETANLLEEEMKERRRTASELGQRNTSYIEAKEEKTRLDSSYRKNEVQYKYEIDHPTRPGVGPKAKALKELLISDSLRLSQLNRKIDSLESEGVSDWDYSSEAEKVDTTFGFFEQFDALERLKYKTLEGGIIEKTPYWYASWLIRLILITIELLPILIKLLMRRTEYDRLMVNKSKLQEELWRLEIGSIVDYKTYNQLIDEKGSKNTRTQAPQTADTEEDKFLLTHLHKKLWDARKEIIRSKVESWKNGGTNNKERPIFSVFLAKLLPFLLFTNYNRYEDSNNEDAD